MSSQYVRSRVHGPHTTGSPNLGRVCPWVSRPPKMRIVGLQRGFLASGSTLFGFDNRTSRKQSDRRMDARTRHMRSVATGRIVARHVRRQLMRTREIIVLKLAGQHFTMFQK